MHLTAGTNMSPLDKKSNVMISLCDGITNRFDPLGARCIMGVIEFKSGLFSALLQDRLIDRAVIIENAVELNPFAIWMSVQPETLGLLNFIKLLSKRYSGPIIIGNVGARGLLKEELSQLRGNIVVVLGQGEDAVAKLYDVLNQGKSFTDSTLRNIPNLRFLDDKQELIETDAAPSTLAKSIIPSQYQLAEAIQREDVITVRSSSGCNFSCVFCTVRDINNKQHWLGHPPRVLKKHLAMIVENGMKTGVVRLVDDDLGGDIDNVYKVAKAFEEINKECSVQLKFGFATRASHFIDSKDSVEQAKKRIEIWEYVFSVGLDSLFLGLESGSSSQLKRLGKSSKAEANFKAASIARLLGKNLEIGFIPIDPFMEDDSWRDEMRDNIRLARHIDAAKTSPTWLAPMRAYEGSPMVRWLQKKSLLRDKIADTDEFNYDYVSTQVVRFLEILGPCFCEGRDNGLYNLKREIKNVQRYPFGLDLHIQVYCDEIINAEISFVESLLAIDLYSYAIVKMQLSHINLLEFNIGNILNEVKVFRKRNHKHEVTDKILNCCKASIQTINTWKASIIDAMPCDSRFSGCEYSIKKSMPNVTWA